MSVTHRKSFDHLLLTMVLLLAGLSACELFSRQRVVYNQQGIEIGIEHDPSTDRTSPPTHNSHPARFAEEEVQQILGVFQVAGYTGTLAGIIADARPSPVFTSAELKIIAKPIATALSQAGPADRVYFSLPNLEKPYVSERTAGTLLVRDPYVHFMLTDHSSLVRTDTAGGDNDKDPRDTKGMRLSVRKPARVATLAPEDVPRWGPLEKVYTTVNFKEVLYAAAASPKPVSQVIAPMPVLPPAALPQTPPLSKSQPSSQTSMETVDDLRMQIRELTNSNLELRERLKEQGELMTGLQEELERLRRDLKPAPSKKSPSKPKVSPPIQ